MVKLLKQAYTIAVLILNIIVRRKHYRLTFYSDETEVGKLWFYKFKHWGFSEMNLLMVDGADVLCERYSNGKPEVTIDVMASRKPLDAYSYDHFIAVDPQPNSDIYDRLFFGRDYFSEDDKTHFWICPVTLFVLGRYPKHLYVKK